MNKVFHNIINKLLLSRECYTLFYLGITIPGEEELVAKGPWGPFMDVILCLAPIIFVLLTSLIKRIQLHTEVALPIAAFLMFLVRLGYLGLPPCDTLAYIIAGFLEVAVYKYISRKYKLRIEK